MITTPFTRIHTVFINTHLMFGGLLQFLFCFHLTSCFLSRIRYKLLNQSTQSKPPETESRESLCESLCGHLAILQLLFYINSQSFTVFGQNAVNAEIKANSTVEQVTDQFILFVQICFHPKLSISTHSILSQQELQLS